MIDLEKLGLNGVNDADRYAEEESASAVEENPTDGYDYETEEAYDAQPAQPVYERKHGVANIVVVGVGGGGNNAVNNMIRRDVKSAQFVVMNTDMQALNMSLAQPANKIQLGANITGGLGAGSNPEQGKKAAEESREAIKAALQGIDLLFITAGMGGGTGTGAAPVIAEIAKSMGILTVAVVTKPFMFEGAQRMKNAEAGIRNLKNFVDTLLVIPNQKLIEVLPKNISFKTAFEVADDVLRQGVQGVSDVITNQEQINLDFADVKTILSNKGLAHMGVGRGKGEKRVIQAVREAVYSPLVETDIEGAKYIILNVSGGEDLLLDEVIEAGDIVRQVVDPSAHIIFGWACSPERQDIEITVIATGFTDKATAASRSFASIQSDSAASNMPDAFKEAAADEVKAEAADEMIKPKYNYNPDIFANRPQFNIKPQPLEESVTAAPEQPVYQSEARPEPAYREPVRPEPVYREPVRPEPAVQSRPQTVVPEIERRDDVKSSRVDVSSRQVPAFLRRLKRDRD